MSEPPVFLDDTVAYAADPYDDTREPSPLPPVPALSTAITSPEQFQVNVRTLGERAPRTTMNRDLMPDAPLPVPPDVPAEFVKSDQVFAAVAVANEDDAGAHASETDDNTGDDDERSEIFTTVPSIEMPTPPMAAEPPSAPPASSSSYGVWIAAGATALVLVVITTCALVFASRSTMTDAAHMAPAYLVRDEDDDGDTESWFGTAT